LRKRWGGRVNAFVREKFFCGAHNRNAQEREREKSTMYFRLNVAFNRRTKWQSMQERVIDSLDKCKQTHFHHRASESG